MTIQNFYPVFENGQVLTSASLNDIIDYLEPQDRLTRSRLIGIGVVCGFDLDWSGAVLSIGKGVAVTSEGFLIAEPEVALDRVRPYTVPQPLNADATDAEKTDARYPFLFDGNTQRTAFELLPTSFVPAPGEAAPQALTGAFLSDKTVMLFLERNRETLKNCSVNDCADKGSEMSVTLRRLLVTQEVADKILVEEAALAGRPVDRANHPRLGLEPLAMEKLNVAGSGAITYATLTDRLFGCAADLLGDAMQTGREAFAAYRQLLEPHWPASLFPDGPLPDHHFLPIMGHFATMPALAQCMYDAAHALTLSLNEFLAAAAIYDAECAPDERRFPRHVLLGDPAPRLHAFADAPKTVADLAGFDPKTVRGGAAPAVPPVPRRHHFVPSPLLGGGRASELQALFARFVLIAQSYDTRGLIGSSLRITPSRDGASSLGDRAIPAFLAFDTTGDLYANWSWPRSRAGLRSTISAYALTPSSPTGHPLLLRDDAVDFLRIEGLLGRPLGSAITALVGQKRVLGLSFGIEPVLVLTGLDRDEKDKEAAFNAITPLLLCQMRELDVVFLTMMSGLFEFMVWIVQTVGPLDAGKATKRPAASSGSFTTGTRPIASDLTFAASTARLKPINLDLAAEQQLTLFSNAALTDLRASIGISPNLLKTIALPETATSQPMAVAELYDRSREKAAGGELIDRVRIAVGQADPKADSHAIYPAVALLARAEEMIVAASAPSLASFDQDGFTTAMRGLADAYEVYAAHAETDVEKAGAQAAAANAAILQNRATMATTATQLGGAAMTAELIKKLQEMFEDRILERYADAHPGLEHKGGVSVGGTLVLLYAPRDALSDAVETAVKAVGAEFGSFFRKLIGQSGPDLDDKSALDALMKASVPQFDDQLEQFVVVGDLCLPTLCCDGDCVEETVFDRFTGKKPTKPTRQVRTPATQPEPVTPEEPAIRPVKTGTLKGRVMTSRDPLDRPTRNAILTVRDASGTARAETLALGTFEIELAAGTYHVSATAKEQKSQTERVVLKGGGTAEILLVIGEG